jgi:mono/diheme cytochrome c family protein
MSGYPRLGAAIATVVCLGFTGCDALPGRPRAGKREVATSEVMAFDLLYRTNCAGCHGADGRVGAARPLNDPLYLALVPPDRLRSIINKGVPGTSMPAFGTGAGGDLTDAQIDVLAHGMLDRWGRRPGAANGVMLPAYEAQGAGTGPAEQAHGAAVYDLACARCHGAEGRGGPTGGAIADPSYLALVSDQSLRTTVIAGRSDLGCPDWRSNLPSRPLTSEEIADVVAWLGSRRQAVPGRVEQKR